VTEVLLLSLNLYFVRCVPHVPTSWKISPGQKVLNNSNSYVVAHPIQVLVHVICVLVIFHQLCYQGSVRQRKEFRILVGGNTIVQEWLIHWLAVNLYFDTLNEPGQGRVRNPVPAPDQDIKVCTLIL